MLVNVQGPIVHPFGIFLATLKNSGKIPTFCRNVGILPEHKKYAGTDLLLEPEGQSWHIFCVLVKYQHFYKMLVFYQNFLKWPKRCQKDALGH